MGLHRRDDGAARGELVLDRRHVVLDKVDARPRLQGGVQAALSPSAVSCGRINSVAAHAIGCLPVAVQPALAAKRSVGAKRDRAKRDRAKWDRAKRDRAKWDRAKWDRANWDRAKRDRARPGLARTASARLVDHEVG